MSELQYALEIGVPIEVKQLSNGEFQVSWNDGNSVYITDEKEITELGLVKTKKGLSEEMKLKRAIDSMPYEIVVIEYAKQEAEEMNKSVLEVLLTFAVETLETYESVLMGHVNYEMKEDDPETWKKERTEIKKYIKKLQGYLK